MKAVRIRSIVTTVNGIDLLVTYQFVGSFRPATLEEPEEWPELEIISVSVYNDESQTDIYELLSKKQVEVLEDTIFAND